MPLPQIDAPTAAIIGGLAGFIADNATGMVQRHLDRQHEEKRRKIQWYEKTIKLAKEIKIQLIVFHTRQEIWSSTWDDGLPSGKKISDAVDSLSIEELVEGEVQIGDITLDAPITIEGRGPVREADFPREDLKRKMLEKVRTEKTSRKREIEDAVEEDMRYYRMELTKHFASSEVNLDDSLEEDIFFLLGRCFGLGNTGIVMEDMQEKMHETADELIETCRSEIEDLD